MIPLSTPPSARLTGWRRVLAGPFVDLAALVRSQLLPVEGRLRALVLMALGTALAVWCVVPVHELLRAAGCLLAGGDVAHLRIPALFGGPLVARAVPFVQVVGSGVGRPSGFDTGGSLAALLATHLAPYLLLTVLMGVPLLAAATQARRPFVAGVGLVLGLLPLLEVPGDPFVVGAVPVDRLIVAVGGGADATARSESRLAVLSDRPATSRPEGLTVPLLIVGASLLAGLLVALLLYRLGGTWTRLLGVGTPPRDSGDGTASVGAERASR